MTPEQFREIIRQELARALRPVLARLDAIEQRNPSQERSSMMNHQNTKVMTEERAKELGVEL